MIARFFLALPLLLPALVGCGNAAIDDKIALLKDDGVPPGEFHRRGQPCVLCHGAYKGASPEMVVAGTVFASNGGNPIPINGATILIEDALGKKNGVTSPATREIKTNCAGNFYLTRDDVFTALALETIAFPFKVKVVCPDGQPREMNGRIARDGSCAGCHSGAPDENSPGLVICSGGVAPTAQTCPKIF